MIVYDDSKTQKRVVFPNFADFVADMKRRGASPTWRGGRGGWDGADSLSDAVALCENGWTGGRKVTEDMIASLQTSLKSVARDMVPNLVFDVAGAYPDMGRYLEGEPECMVQFDPQVDRTAGQVCRVLIDCGASAGYSAEWMTKRAAVVAALVQVLTMVGKSVEIWISSPVEIQGLTHDTTVCVHNAGDVLNVDDVAFALGHPAMLRHMIFECRSAKDIGWDGKGVGATVPHLQATLDYLKPELVVQRVENEPKGTPDPVASPEVWLRFQLKRMGLLD